MKRILLCLALMSPGAAMAQDSDAPSLLEEGLQQFLEGLIQEMEPALEGMQEFMEEMGPALSEMWEEIGDWNRYEAPEILPNGDIIIRRKPDAPAPDAPEPRAVPEGQIEL